MPFSAATTTPAPAPSDADVNTADRPLRLGEVLVQQGVLTPEQAAEVVEAQAVYRKPFGVVAEELLGVSVREVETAWVAQYEQATGLLDLGLDGCSCDPVALEAVDARQARQFQLLPLSFDANGELLIAACRSRLARAVAFAAARIPHPVFFRLVDPTQLIDRLEQHYPLPGASAFVAQGV